MKREEKEGNWREGFWKGKLWEEASERRESRRMVAIKADFISSCISCNRKLGQRWEIVENINRNFSFHCDKQPFCRSREQPFLLFLIYKFCISQRKFKTVLFSFSKILFSYKNLNIMLNIRYSQKVFPFFSFSNILIKEPLLIRVHKTHKYYFKKKLLYTLNVSFFSTINKILLICNNQRPVEYHSV